MLLSGSYRRKFLPFYHRGAAGGHVVDRARACLPPLPVETQGQGMALKAHALCHAMDPQQRLLLEFGYIALHAVCGLRESLRAADVGVFLRIMNADFATLHMQGKSVYAATGGTISIAAGRISFVLGTPTPDSSDGNAPRASKCKPRAVTARALSML